MKLYNLKLIQEYEQYQDISQDLTDRYWEAANQSDRLIISTIITAERERLQHLPKITKARVLIRYNYITFGSIERYKIKHRDTIINNDPSYKWLYQESEPLLLLPKNLQVIKSNHPFYKHDFYGHKGLIKCQSCDEKTQGYLITKGCDETTGKGGDIIVSFCYSCETKYYNESRNREIVNMVRFAKLAIDPQQIRVRQRGGERLTLDEMTGVDSHEAHINALDEAISYRQMPYFDQTEHRNP